LDIHASGELLQLSLQLLDGLLHLAQRAELLVRELKVVHGHAHQLADLALGADEVFWTGHPGGYQRLGQLLKMLFQDLSLLHAVLRAHADLDLDVMAALQVLRGDLDGVLADERERLLGRPRLVDPHHVLEDLLERTA
jgi:hypothetical protein